MIPKVRAALRALDAVTASHIIDGRVPHSLLLELLTERGVGTMVTRGGARVTHAASAVTRATASADEAGGDRARPAMSALLGHRGAGRAPC